MEHRSSSVDVEGRQVCEEHALAPSSLCYFELLEAPEEDVSTRRLLSAMTHVLVCIAAATICSTPSTEPAWAPGALEREAADKVEKGLTTPRALEGENVLDDVVPRPTNTPLLLIEGLQPSQLSSEPRLHLALELRGAPLLEQVEARLRVAAEDLRTHSSGQVHVGVGRGVARPARTANAPLVCLPKSQLSTHGCLDVMLEALTADEVWIPVNPSALQALLQRDPVIQTDAARPPLVARPSKDRSEERILQDLLCFRPCCSI
mmetsp:Transcript_114410/g.356306  ORF Transcript_114410/g.356306 Transcript_114410/m.356306 type:complete len:262 (-) Transcript_114410:814-1599(-)